MKFIQKRNPEPEKLNDYLVWVANNNARFSTLNGEERWGKLSKKKKHKQALQDTIIEEQGYICAYCNRPIHKQNPEDDEQLRLEHIEPKATYPEKTFDYYNLLGCCFGDEREKDRISPPRSLHCDVSKGEKEIPKEMFPTNINCEKILLYSSEGEISSTDSNVYEAINSTLNLNCEKLLVQRNNIIKEFTETEKWKLLIL